MRAGCHSGCRGLDGVDISVTEKTINAASSGGDDDDDESAVNDAASAKVETSLKIVECNQAVSKHFP